MNCGKCKRPFKPSTAQKERAEKDSAMTFYCQKCTKDMVNERIANNPKTLKYVAK